MCVRFGNANPACSGVLPPTGGWDKSWKTVTVGQTSVNKGLVDVSMNWPQGFSNIDKIVLRKL